MGDEVVGVCGLLCSECDAYKATMADDAAAIEAIAKKASEQWGVAITPEATWCAGCVGPDERKSGYTGECQIRACAVDRGLTSCAECTRFPCDKLNEWFDKTADKGTRDRLESMRPTF
jgi:Protein of unknown function (DUF3795)